MAYSHHERLSALDNSFLDIENGRAHMHIGAVAIFEAGPLTTPDGGVDVERVRRLMEAGIHRVPRYRQRLAWTPVFGQPVWVDDERFNLAYHVRHTHLPKPGDLRQLKRLMGRVMSQELDRGKPLWEMWIVEGLDDGRFAIITKAHHCMIDGVGSVQLTGSIMRPTPDPDPSLADPPARWLPRPAPSPLELFGAELAHRATGPIRAACGLARALTDPAGSARAAREAVGGVAEALGAGFTPASATPFNVTVGPHRRFDWAEADLAALKAVGHHHGAKLNDVVLAILAGAVGRFFHRRGIDPAPLDFRVMIPVNARDDGSRHDVGNRVTMMVVGLPIAERDPVRRLAATAQAARQAKHSRQAAGVRSIEDLSDWTFPSLMSDFARVTALARPFNVVVTNVPGPPFPVWVEGARMLACYPMVPLYANQALGVALFSYDGRLYWGFNADWDALPDLHDLVEAVQREIDAFVGLGAIGSAAAAG